jgi:hypothetical protein
VLGAVDGHRQATIASMLISFRGLSIRHPLRPWRAIASEA